MKNLIVFKKPVQMFCDVVHIWLEVEGENSGHLKGWATTSLKSVGRLRHLNDKDKKLCHGQRILAQTTTAHRTTAL